MRLIQSMHLMFGYFVLYTPIYRLTSQLQDSNNV